MGKEAKLVAEERTTSGSGEARRLRREGWVPAIINDGKGGTRMIRLNRHDFELMLHRHSSESLMVDMDVGKERLGKVLLKEVQHDPLSGNVLHADFAQVAMDKLLRVSIGVQLMGEPEGVTQGGGVLEHLIREIEVECLPDDMVETFEVNVSHLNVGDSLLVSDMNIDQKFKVLTPKDVALAAVLAPRLEEEKPEEEEPEEVSAEPEVISEKGKQEAEEEEK